MERLSQSEIEFITQNLKDGKPLPDSYRYVIPFETKKEYELTYADKEREEDILADTFAVPLQPIKTFGTNGNGWTNKLIFGDNLQVLKTLTNDPEVKGKVRLIYIDPPFATRQEFRGSQDQKAYQDKIAGAEVLEFLRKRLVLLMELLSEDGNFIVHLDNRRVHYVKLMMDEILGETNFVNEIVWHKGREGGASRRHSPYSAMPTEYQNVLIYAKRRGQRLWNAPLGPYKESTLQSIRKDTRGWFYRRGRMGRTPAPWEIEASVALKSYISENPKETKEEVIRRLTSLGAKYVTIGDIWNNELIKQSTVTNYPTEKPEDLLHIIIEASSNPSDLVLDAFAGSGTTGAVAEKLSRRWIMIDCGKLAIYTMQKRLLNLREEIGNRGKPLKAKPFTLYNAGLYDYQKLKQLPWEEYRDFVLKLFQCRDEKHRIAGIELDGYLGADDVLVFNYQEYKDAVLDRGFIDDLHSILGDKIGRRFFTVAPAASVAFLEDYIEKGNTRYFLLRIPYSIIDELHRKGFTHIKQPASEMDVNDTVDAVGFDFIQIPDIECEYYLDKPKGQAALGHSGKDAVTKIKKFESNIISKKPLHYENFETLSMVMVDYDYNGEVFNFDDVFYAEDLKKQDYEIRFDSTKLDGQMMLIYIDIFGNEKREVKRLRDFVGRRRI